MADDDFEDRLMNEYRSLAVRISDLNGELKELRPRFEKISEAIKAYGLEGKLDRPKFGDDPKPDAEAAATKGQDLSSAAAELINKNGNRWTKLSDIYDEIVKCGIAIGGKNPSSTLSAHLSNSKMFESDRARGWRLKKRARTILDGIDVQPQGNKLMGYLTVEDELKKVGALPSDAELGIERGRKTKPDDD